MEYKKVICIKKAYGLTVNKEYIGSSYEANIFIYDKKKFIGIYSRYLFKEVEKIRNEKINDILNV